MSNPKRTGHYVVSTHWDREWYDSFQNFRFRLVNLMDELLDEMKRNPEFRYFQSDGQSIMIEDYLEIRPEREADIKALAQAGRLRIGPWYVLPDEFLVSGESLIRNIQMGLKVASRFGTPSRVGFACDMFGHISQLPQIFRGFGIDNTFIWRGAGESKHGAVFRWQSPDGSEVIAYRFNPLGYSHYVVHVRKGTAPDEPFDMDSALKGLHELVDSELKRCPTSSFLVFDGGDHVEIEPQTGKLLAKANLQLEDAELVHSHLEGFVEDLREQRDKITNVVVGELREPPPVGDCGDVIPGVLSSRIHLKQANARCEAELCLWAEPFSTFAAQLGQPYPARYLEVAWRYLLQNHPHDSICGCSVDQVHKDMEYRFDQCHGIASHLTKDALQYITDRVQIPTLDEKDLAVVLFNPTSEPIDGPVDLTLRFPSSLDSRYIEWFSSVEKKIGFCIHDPDGQELPYQLVGQRMNVEGFRRPLRKFPDRDWRDEVDVTVALKIPAYGYTTVVCRPAGAEKPTRHLGSMAVDDHTIANELLQVAVNPNGTLTVADQRTGRSYENLLTLEDRTDIGDGWYHGTAVNEQIYTSVASSASVALGTDGIGKATLKIQVTMQVPECFNFERMVPSDQMRPLVVTHYVTLRQGSDAVEVRTVVENSIRDHRLRVLMPSGTKADTYLADSAFDVVERPIALRADNACYKEMETETKPQCSWTAVFDDSPGSGLAVVSTGLPESAVRDQPNRPIALTLLRAVGKVWVSGRTEGGQIQGTHEFNYMIVPLQGSPDVARLTRLGQRLAAGIRAVQVESRDLAAEPGSGRPARDLQASHSFLEIGSDEVVVAAIHHLDEQESASLRMFNPTAKETEVLVAMEGMAGRAELTDFEGKPTGSLACSEGTASVPLASKKIVTVRLT